MIMLFQFHLSSISGHNEIEHIMEQMKRCSDLWWCEIVLLIEIEIANYCQSKSPTENNWTDLSNGDLSRLINNFSNDKCQNYRN